MRRRYQDFGVGDAEIGSCHATFEHSQTIYDGKQQAEPIIICPSFVRQIGELRDKFDNLHNDKK